jgi:23S rRNA (uridine2552-2'-O)-methyltransferase
MKRSTPKKRVWQDHYTRQAKKENYPARSVFKLQEMQAKYRLIKPGDRVLDLGCAPGSWLLYTARLVGQTGQVLGVDQSPVELSLPAHVRVLNEDVFQLKPALPEPLGKRFDVVISDMAPATTGNRGVDAARSYQLSCQALELADRLLVPGGHFACKIFQGPDFEPFREQVRRCFVQQRNFKPKSSRKASKEIFVIGLGKK